MFFCFHKAVANQLKYICLGLQNTFYRDFYLYSQIFFFLQLIRSENIPFSTWNAIDILSKSKGLLFPVFRKNIFL